MIEPCYSTIGTAIRAYRRSRGMDQRMLADLLGFQRVSSISDIEHGRGRMQVHTLLKCAEIFECSVEALLSGTIEETQRESMEIKDNPWREY